MLVLGLNYKRTNYASRILFFNLSCIDNLYKTMTELNPKELKDKLSKPTIAAQFELNNQTFPIPRANLTVYSYCFSKFW